MFYFLSRRNAKNYGYNHSASSNLFLNRFLYFLLEHTKSRRKMENHIQILMIEALYLQEKPASEKLPLRLSKSRHSSYHVHVLFFIFFSIIVLVGYISTIMSSGSNQSLISRSASSGVAETWITFS